VYYECVKLCVAVRETTCVLSPSAHGLNAPTSLRSVVSLAAVASGIFVREWESVLQVWCGACCSAYCFVFSMG